jgi:aminoglycoside 3-N-acetyltransferase
MISEESIIADFRNLGVNLGDNIFITINIGEVGFWTKNRYTTLKSWISILKQVVGESGSFSFASYTSGRLVCSRRKNFPVFTRNMQPYTGPLPSFLVDDECCIRSMHPTNSVIGYGHVLADIFKNHDSSSMSYSVMGELAKLPNSKFLLIGTLDNFNAPQSFHYVQELMGITRRHPLSGLFGIYYLTDRGKKTLFRRMDIGGCSSGGYKLLGDLFVYNILNYGRIGNARATLSDAKKEIEFTLDRLTLDVGRYKCDDKKCFECRGHLGQSTLVNVVLFYFGNFLYFLKKGIQFILRVEIK